VVLKVLLETFDGFFNARFLKIEKM